MPSKSCSPDRLTQKGANQGVGFECAKELLNSPNYHVILACRSISNANTAADSLRSDGAKGSVEPLHLDVTDEATVNAAVKQVTGTHSRIDTLVNNAGILEKSDDLSHVRFRRTFETNVVGVVLVTDAFLPLLRKSSNPRLVFVSSSIGSLTHAADPESPYYNSARPFPHYRTSKAALNMLLIEYQKSFAPEGFKVIGADPGLVATNFLNKDAVLKNGALGADAGGKTVAEAVTGERDADLGRVVGRYGVSPW